MQHIRIITPGKTKEPWLLAALAEYEKRLKPWATLEWHFVRDDEQLLLLCEQEKELIALDVKGISLSSEEFSEKTERARLTFVIGGPVGLPKKLVAKEKWSLSNLTFTHQLTRLLLAEQLYRAIAIRHHLPYAK
ncbi:MAG: 23S rRNA (pseudouridine(1915)-N(3))-methyltransferase RlmH [Verrucomicrobia bacterium]|nr:23S rRNA (pseudouridine(1915)-N(3))-methyltransferase RlmH [Verrucomicrobiota bacterium]